MSDKKDFEAWIEIKRIWLNIAGNADKWDFTQSVKNKIQAALNQIENLIREVKIDFSPWHTTYTYFGISKRNALF